MTEKKDSNKNAAPQGDILKISEKVLPPKIEYDVEAIRKFINFVFDVDNLEEDENILVWKKQASIGGGYPSEIEDVYKALERSKKPSKLYFATSTTTRHPTGELRAKHDLFKQFYVLVLDDIGTKIPVDKIPEDFTPSYIIETSPGNFQYGYVLDEPITVLEEAKALVQLVYEGGYSDAGGKLAVKQVRLPEGVNGKPGDNRDFRVRLTHMDEDMLWSPADILEKLDLGVDWQDVVDDAEKVMRERAPKGQGASAWSPIKASLPALNGIVDPVAEWLAETGQIKQESDEWLTIKCPWSDTHSDGQDWASYSPLGWGGAEWRKYRSFHCFHDHCRDKKAPQFLEYVADSDGPAVPVSEQAYDLVSRYVWDRVNSGVWDITQPGQPGFVKKDDFAYDHPHKVHIPGMKAAIAETTLFKLAKNRVDVRGVTYDPTTTAKIVEDGGVQKINLYTQPEWGDGDFDPDDLAMFKQFMNYLIPADKEREFFLDWLAAKAQDMAFRGPAILMIAPSQGTGRSTLGNMIATLFGTENVEQVPFDVIAKGGGSDRFNEWAVSPIIVTDETLALGDEQSFYKVYERIKELIDTTPKKVRVNPKTRAQRFQMTYSSYLLFSNHANAMKIAENDRRIYVLDNAYKPASPEYFIELNAWLSAGTWARSIWRWLRKREVDVGKLVAPPEKTRAKDDMLRASKRPLDIAAEAVLAHWPTDLIAYFQLRNILDSQQFKPRLQLADDKRFDPQLQAVFRNLTLQTDVEKMRVGGKVTRIKFIKSRPGAPVVHHDQITHELTDEQFDDLRTAVDEALSEHDF